MLQQNLFLLLRWAALILWLSSLISMDGPPIPDPDRSRALPSPRIMAEENRPNILIAISDDQSYPHASAYGSRMVSTPHFDAVARNGVLFYNAFVASPGCSPSRAAMLTGRYPWQIEHAGTHASYFSNAYTVFPDILETAGYHIGFTGKGWGPGDWAALGRARNPAGPEYNDLTTTTPEGINGKDYAGNFEAFLDARAGDEPFYFWYGSHEPHRVFKDGIGIEQGKKLFEAEVPAFLPDAPAIRSDLLDYAVEIQHFDRHLGKMLALLEANGELDNTLVIVTSDNGMAFPRAKANTYEYGIHVPLAMQWAAGIPHSQHIQDPISLIDLHPTILAASELAHPTPDSLSGLNLLPLLRGEAELGRQVVFSARERHSSSRYNSLSYPQRAIRNRDYLLITNLSPERWPAGAPQKYEADGSLGPMHGGYHDIDACPTLDYLIANRDAPTVRPFFHASVNKRPAYELYDVHSDPACMINLAGAPGYEAIFSALKVQLEEYLVATGDPWYQGKRNPFDAYPRVSRLRWFPQPPWAANTPVEEQHWLKERQPEWYHE